MRVPVRAAPGGGLAARLTGAERRGFVGRAAERELFAASLAEETPRFAVLFLHGPGGIGKTALVRRLVLDARAAGAMPVLVDCRALQPSPAGLTAALARQLGLPADADPLEAVQGNERPVLVLDTFERCAGLQTWLRTEFLPRFPADALTVIAGRDPPEPDWRLDPGWHELLRVVSLRNLPPEDAAALLGSRGVDTHLHDQVLAVAGGHPLALCLVAELLADAPDTAGIPDPGSPDLVRVLLERFVDEAPSPRHRAALEVCAHARVTSESVLRAVLGEGDARELFGWLRERSFVEEGAEGLYPHDLARDVLDAELRWRDPDRYAELHGRLREYLTRRWAEPGVDGVRVWRDLLFLHRRNPVMAPFLKWEAESSVVEEPFRPADRPAVLHMAERAEGPGSAAIVAHWLARQPHGCHVYRHAGAPQPVGFAVHLRLGAPPDGDGDPVATAAWAHAEAQGALRPGEHVDVLRTFVVPGAYHRPSPVMDLIQVRCAWGWTASPRPALTYLVLADPAFWAPQMDYIDHHPAGEVTVGTQVFSLFAHDWRAVPVADWFRLLAGRELVLGLGTGHPPPVPREVLSAPEFEAAVKGALRCWRRPADLARNPLCRSRVVAEAAGGGPPAAALAGLLVEATDALAEDPRDGKLHRVVATTFFKGVPTQEAAAERLGLPFSTYRRHLAAGLARVTAWLWARELYGSGQEPSTG